MAVPTISNMVFFQSIFLNDRYSFKTSVAGFNSAPETMSNGLMVYTNTVAGHQDFGFVDDWNVIASTVIMAVTAAIPIMNFFNAMYFWC